MRLRFIFSFILVFGNAYFGTSQSNNITLKLIRNDSLIHTAHPKLNLKTELLYQDTSFIKNTINEQIRSLGFIDYQFDSINKSENALNFFYKSGKPYYFDKINLPNEVLNVLQSPHSFLFQSAALNTDQLNKIYDLIISHFENEGYPFASVRLVNITDRSGKIEADLQLEKGKLIRFDTLTNTGAAKVKNTYLMNALGVKNGDLFSQAVIDLMPTIIQKLEFIEMQNPPTIRFTDSFASVNLNLKELKSNNLELLFGFFTNQQTSKIEMFGNVSLKLMNPFGAGEELHFDWQRIIAGTQTLNLKYAQPYLFRTKFGADYSFDFFRKDSTFLNVSNSLNLTYRLSHFEYVYARTELFSSQSNLLKVDSNYRDVNSAVFGVGIHIDRRNSIINPSKGLFVDFNIMTGKRNTTLNSENGKQDFDFKTELKLETEFVQPIYRPHIIVIGNLTRLINADTLAINELYRIGGYKTLRGFDEQSIYTQAFSIFKVEYRLVAGKRSYISAFSNIGLVASGNHFNSRYYTHTSFGIGSLIDTGAGILNFILAIGKTNESNFVFRNTKVHFGYVIKF